MSPETLAQTFWARTGRVTPAPDGLEELLSDRIAAARAVHPRIHVAPSRFAQFLGERLPETADALRGLTSMRVDELYLTCACTDGDGAAQRELERRHFARLAEMLGRRGVPPATVDEVKQLLRVRLFLSAPPKIAAYAGRGPLAAFIQLTGMRVHRNAQRSKRRTVPIEDEPPLAAADPDPELNYMKLRYRREFREAFELTLQHLSVDERAVLRLYFLDGMRIEDIGALYRVSASTISRRIARLRKTILAETRRLLRERLDLDEAELASVMKLVQSDLDLSISRMLRKIQ